MTQEQEQLLLVRGTIASLPINQQVSINKAVAEIRMILAQAGDAGEMAIILIGAELADRLAAGGVK